MIIPSASGASLDTALGKPSPVEGSQVLQTQVAARQDVAGSDAGPVTTRASLPAFEGPGLQAGGSMASIPAAGPSRHEVLSLIDKLGLDWHGATIAWCARRLPAFAEASAAELTSVASTILDAARRFSSVGEIRTWYESKPVFGTVRRACEPPPVTADPPDAEPAEWSADAWASYDLTDAAFKRDTTIHLALLDWREAAPLPLTGVFKSLEAAADFAAESSTRAYCYSAMSSEDLRTVRSFQPLLEGIPEAVVVKRTVLDRQPPLVAILVTHQDLIARPRQSVVDSALAQIAGDATAKDELLAKLIDRRIHEDLVTRLRQEAAGRSRD